MTACDLKDFTCGTGLTGGSIPKPNDPDNFGSISAEGLVGGIRVRWSFPLMNAYAVAHIRVFRGSSSVRADAQEVAKVNSSFFEDWFDGSPKTYYYWIQFVSVQGTEHEWIGPAYATSFSEVDHYLEVLHGSINSGVLAQELRKEIDLIQLNKLGITQEMIERAKSDDALGVAFNEIKAFTETTRALVQDETLARASADEAFVSTVNTLYAELQGNIAAVQNERLARINATEALAKNIETTQTVLQGNISSVQTTMQSKINVVDGKVQEIGALYTARVSVNGLIGGFGIYNNGQRIDAGFDVDRFWIGSSSRKYKPFIIDGSRIYFNGKVTFSNLEGAGALASKNSLQYGDLTGTEAQTVKNNAATGATAASRVNNWVRPGTTSIDGNKIWTGDAYVDTLQIQGSAVTANERVSVSTGSVSGGSWKTLATKSISHPGSYGSGVIVLVSFVARSGGGNSDPEIYVYRNGSQIGAKGSAIGYSTAVFHAFYDQWPGANPSYSVRLRAADGGGQNDGTIVQGGEVIFMSSKR